MIGHKAIGRNGPIEPMTYFPKQAEEPYPIFIIKINGLTPVTTRSNVVQQACQFESKRSCHKNSIAQNSWNARPDPFLFKTTGVVTGGVQATPENRVYPHTV